ncbi:lytic transglycosylase domain-containing protein, partial [Ralstonia pseudosolanacearum]
YYSGNFNRGFQVERGGTSYVERVAANATAANPAIDSVPAIPVVLDLPATRASSAPAPARSAGQKAGSAPETPAATAQDERAKARAKWDAFGDFRTQ